MTSIIISVCEAQWLRDNYRSDLNLLEVLCYKPNFCVNILKCRWKMRANMPEIGQAWNCWNSAGIKSDTGIYSYTRAPSTRSTLTTWLLSSFRPFSVKFCTSLYLLSSIFGTFIWLIQITSYNRPLKTANCRHEKTTFKQHLRCPHRKDIIISS